MNLPRNNFVFFSRKVKYFQFEFRKEYIIRTSTTKMSTTNLKCITLTCLLVACFACCLLCLLLALLVACFAHLLLAAFKKVSGPRAHRLRPEYLHFLLLL